MRHGLFKIAFSRANSGLIEIIKSAIIVKSKKLNFLLNLHLKDGLNNWKAYPWDEIIYQSLKVKASLVEKDPFDLHGLQKGLNYGHTFGHSLEGLSGYKMAHGLAVGIGMKIAGFISNELNLLSNKELETQNKLLSLARLDLSLPAKFDISAFMKLLKKDKVNNGAGIRLVLLEKLGKYHLKSGISESLISNTIIKVFAIN